LDLSIVSGTYNRLPFLQSMVKSIHNSVKNLLGLEYEIVLVDGGSTDGTIEWCQSQPHIRLIQHGQLLGAVKAFNDGAYTATGKYVIMANDDIEFVSNSIALAYVHMETNPNCGAGCFYQNRNDRDWHVDSMQAILVNGRDVKRVHVYYAQVGIFPKWLGDLVGWWCDEIEYGRCLKGSDYKLAGGAELGLRTYGGDNELSARIIDLGFTVNPIEGTKITDKEAVDELRKINNIDNAHDPRAVKGHHPDSWKYGQKWIRKNAQRGIHGHYPGPIVRDKPQIKGPDEMRKERILYLPIFEQGWQVQKEQKRGLRDALAKKGIVREYDYFTAYNQRGKNQMMADLRQHCYDLAPTIILTQIHNDDYINPSDLKVLRSITGAKMINWNGDYWPDQLLDEKGLELARSFDLMTTVNRDVMDKHQAIGINTQYWQIGWEPDGRNYEPEKEYDIVFLASGYSPKRQELGKFLKSLPYKVGLYGSGWPNNWSEGENLYNFREACKIYRGAKIAIGDSQWPESGFVSNRIFQILAAGNCVLCHQWFRGIEELGLRNARNETNYFMWHNLTDLGNLLEWWLSNINIQKLPEIAAAGEQLALKRHSFDNRVDELWEMIGINQSEIEEEWRW